MWTYICIITRTFASSNYKKTLHMLLPPTSIYRLWSLTIHLVPYKEKLHSLSSPLLLPPTTIREHSNSKHSLMSMAGCFWIVTSIGFFGFALGLILDHFLPLLLNLGHDLPRGTFGWPLLGETLSFLKPHPSNSIGAFLHDHCFR